MSVNHFPDYSVSVFDPSVRLPSRGNPKRTCGLWRIHSRHDTFEEAFEMWKTLFESDAPFPYILKNFTCIFDGYSPDDRNTPILDLKKARIAVFVNKVETMKYLRQIQKAKSTNDNPLSLL